MANWPSTLPTAPLLEGYTETISDPVLRSEMDAGPPKTRRKYSAVWPVFHCIYILTNEQYETLMSFYLNTVKAVKSFYWPHPRTGENLEVYFDKPPEITEAIGGYYRVSVEIRGKPQ